MLGTRSKLVLAAATILWAGLMVFLLAHVERFTQEKTRNLWWGSLKARWVSHSTPENSNQTSPDLKDESGVINIVMQANNDELVGLVSAVNSVVNNTKEKVHFYFVVEDEKTQEHLERWMRAPELAKIAHTTARLPGDLVKYPHIAKVAFLNLFPSLNEQIIYLDPDVIVQGDLKELLDTPMVPDSLAAFADDCSAGSAAKAVSSRMENRFSGRLNLKHPSIAVLEISPAACSFDTGVIVTASLDIWRKETIADKVLGFIRDHEKESIIGPQGGADQVEAAMLAAFYGRASPLDPIWNVRHLGVTRGTVYSPFFLTTAKLLHWSGHFKPWRPTRGGNNAAAYEQKLWDKYFVRDPTGKFQVVRNKKIRDF